MTTTADKLREAKALIEDPERWCQGALRRDKYGNAGAIGGEVVERCADGAVAEVLGQYRTDDPVFAPLNAAAVEMGFENSACLNESTDHPTVMKMFDRAIELAEREERGDG